MKIGNMYDLEAFKRFEDQVKKTGFADAYTGTVLGRNLTHVSPTILEKKYPKLVFVNSGIQADNTGGYAQQIQTLRLIAQGSFEEAGNISVNSGKISLAAEDTFLNVKERKAEVQWGKTELEQAKLQNVNLAERYVAAVNEVYMREIDEIGFVGKGSITTGLLNNAAFTSGAAAGAATALTAQQNYDEISNLINAQWDGVSNTEEYMATRVTMPTGVFNLLSKLMLNTAAGSSTVLKALRDNFPGVTFNASQRCNSVGGSSRTIAYSVDPNCMVMRLPVPLQLGELVKIGSFQYKTDYMYRIGGLDVLESTSARILTGL